MSISLIYLIYLLLGFGVFLLTYRIEYQMPEKHMRFLLSCCATYMVLPIIMFATSLPMHAILKIFVIVISIIYYLRYVKSPLGDGLGEEKNRIRVGYLLFAVIILVFAYSGLIHGQGFVGDWPKHRSILYSLHNDPIEPRMSGFDPREIRINLTDPNFKVKIIGRPGMDENKLVYYFGMYLPAAYTGRMITGFVGIKEFDEVTYVLSILFIIWNILGLVLSLILFPAAATKLLRLRGDRVWGVFYLGFIVFTGLDYWIRFIKEGELFVMLSDGVNTVWPKYFAQIPSIISHWQFIPNQFVSTFMVLVFLGLYRDGLSRIPLFLCSGFLLSSSPLGWAASIALFVYVICVDYGKKIRSGLGKGLLSRLKPLKTQVWATFFIALLFLSFFLGKQYSEQLGLNRSLLKEYGLLHYILFLFIELAPFAVIMVFSILNGIRIPRIVYFSLTFLALMSLLQLGHYNDLLLKGSLPFVCIIAAYSGIIIQDALHGKASKYLIFLLVFFAMTFPHFVNEYFYGVTRDYPILAYYVESVKQYYGTQMVGAEYLILIGVASYILINWSDIRSRNGDNG